MGFLNLDRLSWLRNLVRLGFLVYGSGSRFLASYQVPGDIVPCASEQDDGSGIPIRPTEGTRPRKKDWA